MTDYFKPLLFFLLTAFFEIAGCFAIWLWLKQGKSISLLPVGLICLFLFAFLLTRVDVEFAGRAYAAYGGVYIVASVVWLYLVERQTPNKWDLIGGAVSILGTFIILFGSRIQK